MFVVFSIYLVTNNINNKRYVGFTTTNAKDRWGQHVRSSRKKTNKNHFHLAINKYGPDNFTLVTLEIGENHKYGLEIAEPLYIKWMRPEYNKTLGGDGCTGLVVPTKVRRIISQHNKKYFKTSDGKIHHRKMMNSTLNPNVRNKIASTQSKNWEIKSPNKLTFFIRNLSEFCRVNNLNQGCMSLVAHGKRNSHMGWKIKLLPILFILMLFTSACGALFPSHYNETEYRTLAEIATVVSLGTCDRATTEKLMTQTVFLDHYTKHLSGDKSTHDAVVLIHEMVRDLYKRVETEQPISETFCTRKLQLIGQAVDTLQQASGGKVK